MGNCATILLRAPEPKCSNHVNAECVPVGTLIDDQRRISDDNCRFDPQRTSFRELGNSEETFFDSQACLDSDCEDYFSVNGDETPSLNGTPINGSFHIDETKPASHNKLLIELFQESFNSGDGRDESKNRPAQKQENKTPIVNCLCIGNKRTGNSIRKSRQPAKCCFPNLVRSLSLSDKKKDTECCLEQCTR